MKMFEPRPLHIVRCRISSRVCDAGGEPSGLRIRGSSRTTIFSRNLKRKTYQDIKPYEMHVWGISILSSADSCDLVLLYLIEMQKMIEMQMIETRFKYGLTSMRSRSQFIRSAKISWVSS